MARNAVRATSAAAESPLLADLNPEQRLAIEHAEGPLLIVAGAGTGKTTVITRRIAWLILERHVPTDGVLALTFTEKAATEMEERVDRLLPYGYVDLWVQTFHGFCERILKRHALDIGLPNDFRLTDQTAAWLLMRRHLDRFNLDYYRPRGNPTKFLHALLQHFSRCKDEAVMPEDYLAYAKELRLNSDAEVDSAESARIEEVANAYHVYQQILLEEGALDFGDLLVYTLQLFRQRPAILARYRKQFSHLLVDEFQDTNWAQYEIVKMLAAPTNNLTVVCDDDQAIYRWRGAAMSNILHFKEDFPHAQQVAVTTNYRSRQNILDAAYASIRQNNPSRLEVTLGFDKKLRAAGKGEGIIEIIHAQDAGEEARMVVEKIIALKDDDVSWNDFAILVRANRQAEQFLPVLNAAGIPYQFFASRGLYRKSIILDILAYLDLLDDYHESTACYRVLNIPAFEFTYDEVLTLTNWAGRKAKSLYEVLREARAVPGVTPETMKKIERVLTLVATHAEIARQKPVREVVLAFLEASGILREITDEETAEDHEQVGYLNQFWKRIEQFEEGTDDPTVKRFMEAIGLEREAGEEGALPADPNAGPEAVRVLTVHAAKGLEFRHVFVVNLIEQRFPSTDRSDPIELPVVLTKVIVPEGDIHLQEERRLFYVACTRAKDGLYLSYADDYGGARKRKPSRFLAELGIASPRHSEEPRDEESHKTGGAYHGVRSLGSGLGMTRVERIISPPTHALPSRLSFTQLKAYQTCPWQYHYAHVLRVPIRGRYVFSFGSTMHLTLQRFFELLRERSGVEQSSIFDPPVNDRARRGGVPSPPDGRPWQAAPTTIPSLEELLTLYERAWNDDWYESPQQKREYFESGKRMLEEFHAKHAAAGWPNVRATEQPFVVKFDQYSVMGKADRIDDLGDGSVEIIDYKTGKTREKLEADDKMQLLIYQVAATQALGLTPKVLSYYYLEDNTKVSFIGTSEELAALAATVADIGQKIANGVFKEAPGRHCRYCDFKAICPYAEA